MTGGRTTRGRVAWLSGRAAEEIAERLYAAEGGTVLARRWRGGGGEVDLVIGLGPVIVFVEVKARRDAATAAAALGRAQMRRLGAAAEAWIALHGSPGQDVRVDVVLVDGAGRAERIENALAFDF